MHWPYSDWPATRGGMAGQLYSESITVSSARECWADELPCGDLLLAEYALHQSRVCVPLYPYRLAVAEGEHLRGVACFVVGSCFAEHDARVAVGEEAVGRGRRRLLGQPLNELAEFSFAAIGTADRAVAGLDPLDVVVEQVHHRVDVTGGGGFIGFL